MNEYFLEKEVEFELVIVDDGSSDRTADLVRREADAIRGIKLLCSGFNQGKGSAVKKGVFAASHDVLLVSDADLSTPIEEVEKLYPWLENGYDIVIGSRSLEDSLVAIKQPWYRQNMGKIFNVLVWLFALRDFHDTQCGFKIFRKGAAQNVFTRARISGFAFDVEVLYIAFKMGYRIKEVPVTWFNSPQSKVRVIRDPALMFFDLLRIRHLHRNEFRQ